MLALAKEFVIDKTIDYVEDNLFAIIEYAVKKGNNIFDKQYKKGDNLNKGIWIGTRGLAILNKIQYTPLIAHWCVKIDGIIYSL